MIAAAGVTGWLLAVVDEAPGTRAIQSVPAPAPPAPQQDFHRTGQVTAVSADSLTTTAADGQVMTYQLTPDTTRITPTGAVVPRQHVVVVGVVRNGVPVATAVADPAAAGGDGPPMDYQLPS